MTKMKCPKCKHQDTNVTVTEQRADHTVRYKRCLSCGYRFRTEERIVKYLPRNIPVNGKLKRDHILRIREIAKEELKLGIPKSETIVKLQVEYNVSFSCIRDVIIGKTWKNIH